MNHRARERDEMPAGPVRSAHNQARLRTLLGRCRDPLGLPVERAFANLVVALSAARCGVAVVAKLTIYVVGFEQEKIGVIRDAVRQHFGSQALPACTLVGVQALGRPEFQIEVEAFAVSTAERGA